MQAVIAHNHLLTLPWAPEIPPHPPGLVSPAPPPPLVFRFPPPLAQISGQRLRPRFVPADSAAPDDNRVASVVEDARSSGLRSDREKFRTDVGSLEATGECVR